MYGIKVAAAIESIAVLIFKGLINEGLFYYGKTYGYNVSFDKELKVLPFSSVAHNLIDESNTEASQKKAAFILHTLVILGKACLFLKFQSDRNSLPLRSYCFWKIGNIIFDRLMSYHGLDEKFSNVLRGTIRCYAGVYLVASRILFSVCMTHIVKITTNRQIQVAWKWEILSYASAIAFNTLLNQPPPPPTIPFLTSL